MLASKPGGPSGVHVVNVRVRMYLTGILLLLSLVCTVVAGRATVSAFQSFQRQNTLMKQGDVRTIRPWMTVPYIARVYQVPESSLYNTLHLTNNRAAPHTTLQMVATRDHVPAEKIIRTVQELIINYRKQHSDQPHALFASAPRAYWSIVGRTMT
jgi:uncharacterized protein YlzI (FlbEa/FlbD family)